MRDFYGFRNSKEFKEIFRRADGSLKNRILLSFLKDRNVFRYDKQLMRATSMATLYSICIEKLQDENGELHLMGMRFSAPGYSTDEKEGICSGGDSDGIAVTIGGHPNMKTRAGKLFGKIVDNSPFGNILNESVKTFLREEFSQRWNMYAIARQSSDVELRTDLTFADIYGNGKFCANSMGSCMTGQKRDAFYNKSVDGCFPAALTLKSDPKRIVSRCVVYTQVKDAETGEVVRLAERQYSNQGEQRNRQLISKLIAAGLIDGYKKFGAGCGDSNAFVSIDGEDWSCRKFEISVDFSKSSILSYQDSFKFYYFTREMAGNYYNGENYLSLSTTERLVNMGFDDYHGMMHFGRLVEAYYNGKRIRCAADNTRDFTCFYIEGRGNVYFHTANDTEICPCCGNRMPHSRYKKFYSKDTGKCYCSKSCKDADEKAYLDKRKFYSAFDGIYVDKARDLKVVFLPHSFYRRYSAYKGYVRGTITRDSLQWLFDAGMAIKYRGKVYVGFDKESKKPFGVKKYGSPLVGLPTA